MGIFFQPVVYMVLLKNDDKCSSIACHHDYVGEFEFLGSQCLEYFWSGVAVQETIF
jgi:hypothetical protein